MSIIIAMNLDATEQSSSFVVKHLPATHSSIFLLTMHCSVMVA